MARSSETFNKRDNEKKKQQKRLEKQQRKEQREADKKGKSLEDMMAYVDENGNLTSTPPDPSKKKVVSEADIDLESRNKGGNAPSFHRQGFVKFFDASKGFGFIKDDQTSEEFFFHYTSADFPIAQNDRVTFETQMGPKGLTAAKIGLRK